MDIVELNKIIQNKIMNQPVQDYGINGIQVENTGNINKIVYGVDFSNEIINVAIQKNANCIIVHHGIFWGKELPITGIFYKRIKELIINNIGLIAYHLPLDFNEEFGNNILILKTIGATENVKRFYMHKNIEIGYLGDFENDIEIDNIISKLNFGNNPFTYWEFGKKKIKRVAVISGSGARGIEEAYARSVDLYITGETDHSVYHLAKELSMNVLFGGHYFTETFGIKGLKDYIERETGIEGFFADIPTNM